MMPPYGESRQSRGVRRRPVGGYGWPSSRLMGPVRVTSGSPPPPVVPTLTPSAAWAGWTGYPTTTTTGLDTVPPPAYDPTLQGSVWTNTPIARHTAWDYRRITAADGETVSVGGFSADPSRSAIKEVRAYLEGGSVVVTSPSWDEASRLWGYVFKVAAPAGKGGLARLVIDVVPVNGPILRIPGPNGSNGAPIILDNNGILAASRVTKYLDPNAASDGIGTQASPWKTFKKAMANANVVQHDMLVICSDGDTDEGTSALSSGPSTLVAPTEFVQASGAAGTCKMSKRLDVGPGGVLRSSQDQGQVRLVCNLVKFNGILFDTSQYSSLYHNPTVFPNAVAIYERVNMADSYSDRTPGSERLGPSGGYYNNDYVNFFPTADGQRCVVVYSKLEAVGTAGAQFCLCNDVTCTSDAQLWSPWDPRQSPWVINCNTTFWPLTEFRYHTINPCAVASFAVTGSGSMPGASVRRVVISVDPSTVFSGPLAYTGLNTAPSRDYGIRFVTGALAGQIFYLIQVDTSNKQFHVYDPSSVVSAALANGDTFIAYIHIHPDNFQSAIDQGAAGGGFMGNVWGARNIVLEGGLCQGSEYQFWFLSSRGYFGRGNLSISGTAGTLAGITKTVSGTSFSSGRTTITFSDGNPIPTVGANLRNTTPVRFLTGALAGQDFPIYSTAAGTYSITLQASAGNLTGSIAVGDTLTPWMLNVGDFVTFKNLAATVANRYEYRQVMSMSGPLSFTLDAAFPGPVSAETNWVYVKNIRDVAIVNSRGQPAAVSDTYSSQFCCGFTNMLVAQNTNLQQILLRNNIADGSNPPIGFGIKDATFVDNIFKSSSYDIAFSSSPPRGTFIDNNLYREADGLGGTNASANVTITLDADLRPLSGVTKTMGLNPLTGRPQIPFAADGVLLSASSVVGALQP